MKYFHLMLLGFGPMLTPPVLAQHEGHAPPTTPAGPAQEAPDPHAGHNMPPPANSANGDQGQEPSSPAANQHLGHDMATMNMESPAAETPPPPEASSGPHHAADLYFDSAAMARSRELLRVENGDFRALFLMADQFELRRRDGEEIYAWDAQGWYGGDINKLWVKTEGEGELGENPDDFEVQTLWSRAIHPWFDIQAGVRLDFASGFERSHLVVGLQGLLPYRFEIDAASFISDEGDLSARFEGEYDVWLSQRLILQPRLELDVSAQSVPEYSIGSGLVSAELGLRLHYQIVREFAPYLGVEYERLFAGTADYARLAGKERSGWNAVLGVRGWF